VQQEILSKNSQADLRVYAVWFNMLFGDSRGAWTGDGLVDPRVRHFWDEQKAVGNWFSANVTHRGGTTWDFYALYPPEARDLATPASMGGTIIGRHSRLESTIAPLLASTSAS
jgi:hypothetical protein